ncbi:hypothetical protein RQP46_006177 [Phenoliferia psychrophenolica]
MDELEHALASATLQSKSEDVALEPGASSSPFIPPELVVDIIDLAFLLSAALVDRTWNAIATSALLKNGLVRPGDVQRFLEQTEEHGVRETLDRVRFGAGATVLIVQPDSDPPDEGADDEPFQILVFALPNLRTLEFVGERLRFKAALQGIYHIEHLIISNVTYEGIPTLAEKLALKPPARLFIIETRYCLLDHGQITARLPYLNFLSRVQKIDVYTYQSTPHFYMSLVLLLGIAGINVFNSFRLAYDDASWWPQFLAIGGQPRWTVDPGRVRFPRFDHFATHLPPLHYLVACSSARLTLTSLEVLPDFDSQQRSTRIMFASV